MANKPNDKIEEAEAKPGFCKCGARLRSCPWGLQPHGFCPECETDHIKEHRAEYLGGDAH
jgi:hypothetical protein